VNELTGDPGRAVDCLRQARRVLLTFHSSPDGDALGSALGFAELAAALGVSSTVVSRDPAPASLSFLPGTDKVEIRTELPTDFLAGFDLTVVLECPDLDRQGFDNLATLPILNIDHHLANTAYGTVNYVDDEAPAVGEMVLRMADASSVPVTATMATCLYTALVTDTGDFRYSNSTPRAFAAAHRLVQCGARPHEIAEALWSQTPARVVRLVGAVLSTLELGANGRIAVVTCDSAMLAATGAGREDTEGIINYPRSIAGVEVAVLLKSFSDGETRASLRSRGAVDVQEIAASFGGGGHRAASGCTIKAPLAEARRQLLAIVLAALETA
jgi:bifunctional oligoribonuclease and PAP phosphatase NrnA